MCEYRINGDVFAENNSFPKVTSLRKLLLFLFYITILYFGKQKHQATHKQNTRNSQNDFVRRQIEIAGDS